MSLQSVRSIFWALVACIFLATVQTGSAAQGANTLPQIPGLHFLDFPRPGGRAMSYALFIPKNYSPSTPVPLILALHFGVGGGDATGAGGDVLQYLVGPALAELGAIIVAPDSLKGNWSTSENEEAVNALLDTMMASYAIDAKKVAVTGYSMGGQGAWSFGQKFPNRFTAVVPVAGRPPDSASGWKLPVFAVHSRDDQVVPFQPTATRIAELEKAGVNAKLIALNGLSHYETARFQEPLRQAVPWLRELWK